MTPLASPFGRRGDTQGTSRQTLDARLLATATLTAVPHERNPLQPYGHPTAGASLSLWEKTGLPTLLRRSKRTPALKQATRSVSKNCYAVGFTLR
ncbi:MAG: hypothetical protein V7L29_01810 [Nostoc sp.]|uniref:hypothetical protein n=1 Tax=Nostoc sp. TaxID=1180 RepID=UPI002FFA02E9